MQRGIDLKNLTKKGSKYLYRGVYFTPNKPMKSTNKNKKMMV